MSDFYCHINGNEVHIRSFNDSKFQKVVDVKKKIKTHVWTKDMKLVVLTNNVIIIDAKTGSQDTIELKQKVVDICVFQDCIWGCFNGGVVNISTGKDTKIKKNFKSIVPGIYVSTSNEIYKLEQNNFHKVNTLSSIQKIVVADELVVVTKDKVIVGEDEIPITGDVMSSNKGLLIVNQKSNGLNEVIVYREGVSDRILDDVFDVVVNKGELYVMNQDLSVTSIKANGSIPQHNASETSLSLFLDNEDISSTLQYCKNNQNEQEIIKPQLTQLTPNQSNQLLMTLMKAEDINDNPGYGLWLKWLLIINKNLQAPPEFKASLQHSIKLYNHLLAIKGKLQLLHNQKHLREKDVHIELQHHDDSVYIANGEDDDVIDSEQD